MVGGGQHKLQPSHMRERAWQPAKTTTKTPPISSPPPHQRHLPIIDRKENNSRDSGVHTDSEPIHFPSSTHLPPPSPPPPNCPPTHPSEGQTTLQQQVTKELVAGRSKFNPVLRKKSTLLSLNNQETPRNGGERLRWRRRQWEEEEERKSDNPVSYITEKPSWIKSHLPINTHPDPPVMDKTAAAQYYLTRSRYSPLTSGKRSGNKQHPPVVVGFGSQAPRWKEREPPVKRPFLVPKLMEVEKYLPTVVGCPVLAKPFPSHPPGWRERFDQGRESSAGAMSGGWLPSAKPKRHVVSEPLQLSSLRGGGGGVARKNWMAK